MVYPSIKYPYIITLSKVIIKYREDTRMYVLNVYTDIKIYVYSTLTSARHLTKYFNSCMFIIGKDFYVKAKGGLLCVCNE